jgi:MoaA/NifB/PqqE/SkfB family radical SAM enzyme
MLDTIILLLTYQCTLQCDHCYLYCGPRAEGALTLDQIKEVLEEATKIRTVNMIRFQGGEPFLLYPLMLEGIRIAHEYSYAHACHFCYLVRKALIDRFPQFLAPRQVYGLESR